MAYQTGTATGPEDLLDKLFTFASTNGWTVQESTTGTRAHLSKNNVYIGFYYTSSFIKLYPARGYTSSTEPDAQPNVAYNDTLSSSSTGCIVTQITGPYNAYYFFEDEVYLHVVILVSDYYRHFGFGVGVQSGSFNGGEYFYSHEINQSAIIDIPTATSHAYPLTGVYTNTYHLYGGTFVYGRKATSPETALSGATEANTKWFNSQTSAAALNDSDGDKFGLLNISGTISNQFANELSVGSSNLNGFSPLAPIDIYIRKTTDTPDSVYPLISIPDLRAVNIKAFTDAQEITIGSDTWVVFPLTKRGINTGYESCGNHGLAYKKIAA